MKKTNQITINIDRLVDSIHVDGANVQEKGIDNITKAINKTLLKTINSTKLGKPIKRLTKKGQFICVSLNGDKAEIKEKLATYIDTLPDFETSYLLLTGDVLMPSFRETVTPILD